MDLNVTELFKYIIDTYGIVGFALMFWVWHGWQMQKRIDKLQSSCNKMFGIMLGMADKRYREEQRNNGRSLDD